MEQNVIICQSLADELQAAIAACRHDRIFVVVDVNTRRLCWPLIAELPCMEGAQLITIGAGEENKSLDTVSSVWSALQQGGATRHSLVINLGGGMVTDLGGFAASTFKRGLTFINIPTTLLAMVDASVGGKTGINYGGLKNEVGTFTDAAAVLLDARFLLTLDASNILSGYAEMLKHGIISNPDHWVELINYPIDELCLALENAADPIPDTPSDADIDPAPLLDKLAELVAKSVAIKQRIVGEDPTENALRKALNLGHTAGHALESLAMQEGRTVPHGYAVAWGMVCELYLSTVRLSFPHDRLRQMIYFVKANYGSFPITCDEYERLYNFMLHDKKNIGNDINFTLVGQIGDIHINEPVGHNEIFDMLDFFRENV